MSRPRNRLLHEAMERCGLVERSGQGADLMFREALRSAKPAPSYDRSDNHTVFLTLNGQVRDARLLAALEQVQTRLMADIGLADLRIIDALFHGEQPPPEIQARMAGLVDAGIVERTGRGRFVLAHNLYAVMDKRGAYTRRKSLARPTEKALLLQHIQESASEGSPMRDLMEVLPGHGRIVVRGLLNELRADGKIHVRGQRAVGRWFPGPTGQVIPNTAPKVQAG